MRTKYHEDNTKTGYEETVETGARVTKINGG
jgi:hypothetical protein